MFEIRLGHLWQINWKQSSPKVENLLQQEASARHGMGKLANTQIAHCMKQGCTSKKFKMIILMKYFVLKSAQTNAI